MATPCVRMTQRSHYAMWCVGPLGHADLQIVIPAMRMYIGSDRCDPPKLIAYSRHLGVERKISGYLEVLL